jgi:hypothetical protein
LICVLFSEENEARRPLGLRAFCLIRCLPVPLSLRVRSLPDEPVGGDVRNAVPSRVSQLKISRNRVEGELQGSTGEGIRGLPPLPQFVQRIGLGPSTLLLYSRPETPKVRSRPFTLREYTTPAKESGHQLTRTGSPPNSSFTTSCQERMRIG